MDWSEILTESEANFMQSRVFPHLAGLPWARPLVDEVQRRGGLTYDNKPMLFEAHVAYALARAGANPITYEHPTGVGSTTVDFRIGTAPTWLVEVVSIQRSNAARAATISAGPFTVFRLSSPQSAQSEQERRQSEEGESLLVVQKIGEKVYDRTGPIKFPPPQADCFHMLIVDMRGHFGGGDIHDWKQIAFSAEVAPEELRKYWLLNDRRVPMQGVWSERNPMRFAATARQRLHAIMFVAEEVYADDRLTEGAWIAGNPHLFRDEATARAVLQTFPLRIQ
jgi:hypothetical protein